MADLVHMIRHFSKPHDIGPQLPRNAAGRAGGPVDQRAGPAAAHVACRAPGIEMLPVHVHQPFRPAPFVQIVNILGHDQQLAPIAPPQPIEPPQCDMRCIGRFGLNRGAPHVIEIEHQIRVAGKGLRRCHILHPVLLPDAAFGPEGINAAFGADARTRQDDNVANVCHGISVWQDKGLVKMAQIGIIGSKGRMGRALALAIGAAGHELAGGVDRGDDAGALAAQCAVLIDFSTPDALEMSIDAAVAHRTALLIGTTGLDERHHWLIDDAARDIAILQTGNTSLGITLLAALVRDAAARLGPEWDIEIVEMHHRMKVDAPSGTALLLGEAAAGGRAVDLASHSERGRDGITGPRSAGAIGFASLRGGTVAGDHSVIFAGEQERIELSHRAEDRSIFARGAVRGAEWLLGQKAGRYQMADVLGL